MQRRFFAGRPSQLHSRFPGYIVILPRSTRRLHMHRILLHYRVIPTHAQVLIYNYVAGRSRLQDGLWALDCKLYARCHAISHTTDLARRTTTRDLCSSRCPRFVDCIAGMRPARCHYYGQAEQSSRCHIISVGSLSTVSSIHSVFVPRLPRYHCFYQIVLQYKHCNPPLPPYISHAHMSPLVNSAFRWLWSL